MRSMVEGACLLGVRLSAPSTALRAVPLPRYAGADDYFRIRLAAAGTTGR